MRALAQIQRHKNRSLLVCALLVALFLPNITPAHGDETDHLTRAVDYIAQHGVSAVPSSDGGTLLVLQTQFDHAGDPDLRILLGKDGIPAPETDLGPLAQITGLQVFKAPPTMDIAQFDSLHIWDSAAGRHIGAAPLPN
ncbi:DM13 domain-containing protein [Yoonia sp. BS5-3]|uniref:DM13 domain-containing protein n=1 Tax=Yoonia phaeophyticola TaxID=3137369 RepID=A0ABZ2V8F9_9RHOB